MKNKGKKVNTNSNTEVSLFELDEAKYKSLFKRQFTRLLLTYLLPLVFLVFLFHFEYKNLLNEAQKIHLQSIAENQAQILQLFLRERVVNLQNLIDSPQFEIPPSQETLEEHLEKLKKDSESFTDLGYFDSSGIQKRYTGPLPALLNKDYSNETWFKELMKGEKRYVITDIYLGFRNLPHFTIAVSRAINNNIAILRATLDPKSIYEYISEVRTAKDVTISIINSQGYYQLLSKELGNLLEKSPFNPLQETKLGVSTVRINGKNVVYGYCWLPETQWCVISVNISSNGASQSNFETVSILISIIIILALVIVMYYRAEKIVQFEKEKEISEREKKLARLQLEHAAKLATVGELAAGIAHEINNPLAIIASEAGLIKDLLNPEFKQDIKEEDLNQHLDNILVSVFRARDITRKLMSFVRRDEFKLDYYNVNEIIEELLQGFLEKEFYVSNIQIVKRLDPNIPKILTDANSTKQVLLNLISNARDAITPPGIITISTKRIDNEIRISVKDTGCGISQEMMGKIFLPFFTTKEVGKGTGLGLSVSYNIVKNLGGRIEVESLVGVGSTFIVILPIETPK